MIENSVVSCPPCCVALELNAPPTLPCNAPEATSGRAKKPSRRPAAEIAAGLVTSDWWRLLGDAARRPTTEARRSPRRFFGREAVTPHEARNDGDTHARGEARQQSEAAMKSRST